MRLLFLYTFFLTLQRSRASPLSRNDLPSFFNSSHPSGWVNWNKKIPESHWIPDTAVRYGQFLGKDVQATSGPRLLWPKGPSGFYEVPFGIKANHFTDWAVENIIHWAMRTIERGSNIRFRESTPADVNRIVFENGEGCLSIVGRSSSSGPQRISLQVPDCIYRHSALHEILHALGLYHEHQRSDRAKFVVPSPNAPPEWEKHIQPNPDIPTSVTPYNLASIMHYNLFMNAKDPAYQSVLDTRTPALSSCDWYNLNMLYPGPVAPPPCVPHEHIKACEELPTCPYGDLLCDYMCQRDCDSGLPQEKLPDVKTGIPAPFCRFKNGAKYPPLPETLQKQIEELRIMEQAERMSDKKDQPSGGV